jgi:uncharacterized membrane protein HdeD (DUF308 family)
MATSRFGGNVTGGSGAASGGPDDVGMFGLFGGFTPDNPMSTVLAKNWWLVAIRGVLALIFGVIAVVLPGVTIASLIVLFAAYMLVDGVFAIISAVCVARRHERWGLLIFEGIVNIVAGGIAIVWPLVTLLALVSIMGAWAIVSGALMLTAAFRLNPAHGRWLMALGGLTSIIWGILLLLWPLAGAVVLTLWMGAYALLFGITLLVLALRLRRHRNDAPAPSGAISQGA